MTREQHEAEKVLKASIRASDLTKRELFAAMAMQGLLASDSQQYAGFVDLNELVVESVDYADTLLAELAEETT